MSVLIRGMEMPTRCAECWLMDGEDSWCTACRGRHLYPEYRYGIKDRPDWCPLVPVPPHGRLGDLDALTKMCQEMQSIEWNSKASPYSWAYAYESFESDIDNAPTIIPAEEGET